MPDVALKCERCSGESDVQDTEYIVRKAFGSDKSQFVWSRAVLCRPCREGLAETIGRFIEREGPPLGRLPTYEELNAYERKLEKSIARRGDFF